MLRNNRLAFLTAGFAGSLAIIGAGFSAWVFVGDNVPIKSQMDAGISITDYLEIGILQLQGEVEARKETYGEDCNLYDYSIVDENDETYQLFKQRASWYTYRKIVFTEGNPDSQALDDGMEFLRFYHDRSLDVYTFKLEPYINGKFLVPSSYADKGANFHIGVRTLNIDAPKEAEATDITIDDYVQLNERYTPKEDLSNSFKVGNHYYSAFESQNNSGLYNFRPTNEKATLIRADKTEVVCDVYEFSINLDEMFLYEEGMKPCDRESVKVLHKAIETAKNNGTVETNWRIQFEFASCLYQE